jgi:hypothetical protein
MHSKNILTALIIGASVQCAAARDFEVEPGQSIQAAVDVASAGDRIMVQPGLYHEPGRPCPTDPGNSARSSCRGTTSA